MGKTIIEQLSAFGTGLRFEDLPPEVVEKANDCFFDFVGCYYGAVKRDDIPQVIRGIAAMNPTPESCLWGAGLRCGTAEAALAMGTVGYHLEYDDGISVSGHWGSASIPASFLAVARRGGDGKDLITAIAAGYEVGCRISRMFSPRLLKKHIHFPCTMGAFGAAAGYARGSGASAEELAGALSLAGLFPVGTYSTATSGAKGKGLYSGWPNYLGINALRLSQLGLTGDPDVMEAPDGFANAVGLAPMTAEYLEEAGRDLGTDFRMMQVYFKPYPCCRWLHAPVYALLGLMKRHGISREELELLSAMSPREECGVPGTDLRLSMPLAAFAGSVLASAQEMDDLTSVGASVHPGCCVIPAALAAAEKHGSAPGDLLRAILLGYDLCNRLGLMATQTIRELGLYGPGLIAAPCAAAAAGLLMGLAEEQMEQGVSIALSMSPLCPFSAFTDGSRVKNLYAGWGTYLGVLAAELAQKGYTGPEDILDGEKSLRGIFSSPKGRDVPEWDGRFARAVNFKDYSGCFSVHAAMTAIERLRREEKVLPEEILSVEISTYSYACDLDRLTGRLNPISARTSIAYTAAVMLREGRLDPDSFMPERLEDPGTLELMDKIQVKCEEAFGSGPFGKRGCRLRVRLKDGTEIGCEVDGAKWTGENPATDEELLDKFWRLNEKRIKKERLRALSETIYHIDKKKNLQGLFSLLREGGHVREKEESL